MSCWVKLGSPGIIGFSHRSIDTFTFANRFDEDDIAVQ